MTIIPGINCETEVCIKETLLKLKELPNEWVQIDISDGKFTPAHTFHDTEKFNEFCDEINFSKKIEVHLMVEHPDDYISGWLSVGVKRVIIHGESVHKKAELMEYKKKCESFGAELGIALNPDTKIEDKEDLLMDVNFVQVLAVHPGFSEQKQLDMSEKIRLLRERFPHVTIEVDGGVNEITASVLKSLGVDIVVSVSYILEGKDPLKQYQTLANI